MILPSRSREGSGEGMTEAYYTPTTRARNLRNNPTEAERRLWYYLSARKLAGVRFNRQVPIGPFICDFVSRSLKLVIEIDGDTHGWTQEDDARRTRYLNAEGYRVIRFWNHDVLSQMEGVIAEIARVAGELPSPNPSRIAGGEF